MRKMMITMVIMVFVFSLAWMAGAQTSSSGQSGSSQQYGGSPSGTSQGKESKPYSSRVHGKSMEDQRASKWIGTKVENQEGESLGRIEDLVLGPEGQVDFVIVSHGGTLGIGEKYTAVPLMSFSRKDDKTLVLNMSKERMAQAPSFERNNWPDMSNRAWSEDVYRYYGQKPHWGEPSQKSTQPPSRMEHK